jgi:hypothetical protein
MAAQPTGPPARRCRAFAGANQSNPDLDFRGKSLQTESADHGPMPIAQGARQVIDSRRTVADPQATARFPDSGLPILTSRDPPMSG